MPNAEEVIISEKIINGFKVTSVYENTENREEILAERIRDYINDLSQNYKANSKQSQQTANIAAYAKK